MSTELIENKLGTMADGNLQLAFDESTLLRRSRLNRTIQRISDNGPCLVGCSTVGRIKNLDKSDDKMVGKS